MNKFLIIGLGNIGEEYKHTRHNIGFEVLDAFVRKHNGFFKNDRLADIAEVKWKGKTFICIKPTTYMNLSGRAFKYWLDKEKIEIPQTLTIVDDLALPLNKLRLRGSGSDAGHNGLKDIQQHLSSPQFWRLRFGIGHPRDLPGNLARMDVADYVLKKPSSEEQEKLDAAITKAISILPLILKGNAQDAMQILHGPN